jgi:hypothetical protein
MNFVPYELDVGKDKYDIVVEKEYKTLPDSKTTASIGAVMMVKNEKKRIHVSLDSLGGYIDALIVYDTGSEDDTMDIIQEHCEKHKINLYMIKGEFVDFSTSRNVVLNYADTIDVKFLLLLDVNDELQGGDKLLSFCKSQLNTETTGYLVCQHWWSGKYDKYFNVRMVKNRSGWRYRGVVHEWMKDTTQEGPEPASPIYRMDDCIILYQDRTKDDDKSSKRFKRDRILLYEEYKKNPVEPRTVFYLAQTCSCLKEIQDAFYYYKIRSTLEGFQEEKFHAFLRCGELSIRLKHEWHETLTWYMKAVEHSLRAEPLIKIADYYKYIKNWFLAYTFIKLACSIDYPNHCILFVDKRAYDYDRWHLMSIIGFYSGHYEEGKEACYIAIKDSNRELDKTNLQHYLDREKKMGDTKHEINNNDTTLTKKEFMANIIKEFKQKNPRLSLRTLEKIALKKWKNRN